MTAPRDFDLVLQGATGFTGQLAAAELKRHAPEGFQWAIAGRSQERLRVMSEDLGVPMLVADGLDLRAVDALARQSRVVISCAGPFARFGTPLVDACVAHQTHYADITGELPWIQSLSERHGATCLDSGTTLIPASGFDSVPSDLAVHALVTALPEAMPVFGFFSLRGGLNGGTLHSGIALAEDHPSPFPSLRPVFPASSLGAWGAPFVMGPVNESVVERSALDLSESVAGYGRGLE